jgi:hypothetical protein
LRPSLASPEIAETLPARISAPLEADAAEEIAGRQPSEQVAGAQPETSVTASPNAPVSDAAREAGSTGSLTAEDEPSAADQLSARRAAQLKVNNAAGAAYETATEAELSSLGPEEFDFGRQLTVEVPSGDRTRLDFMTRNRVTGEIGCLECKSSSTAQTRPRQTAVFAEMLQHGATIVGKGKPGFPGGMKIPPTRVEFRRPRN